MYARLNRFPRSPYAGCEEQGREDRWLTYFHKIFLSIKTNQLTNISNITLPHNDYYGKSATYTPCDASYYPLKSGDTGAINNNETCISLVHPRAVGILLCRQFFYIAYMIAHRNCFAYPLMRKFSGLIVCGGISLIYLQEPLFTWRI